VVTVRIDQPDGDDGHADAPDTPSAAEAAGDRDRPAAPDAEPEHETRIARVTDHRATVDDYSTRDEPAGVLRRTETDQEQSDEQFGHDLEWTYSPLLYSYERGNMDNKFYEITEDEANQIVARIRRTVAGGQ